MNTINNSDISELQSARDVIKAGIRDLEFMLKDSDEAIKYFYENSTPDTEIGKACFKLLKEERKAKERIKKELKVLRMVQCRLKKDIAEAVAYGRVFKFINGSES